ncbi:hypothetical protein RND81_10G124500 [Saponaria officinalis]|uniref:Zinc finger MYM-type protein 1-like n=1 Tax=Saponaria officinalis TaxID=3572 RepID=A0AAW1I1J9_SAPOF
MDNQNHKRLKNLFSFFKSNPNNNEPHKKANESGVKTENDHHERVAMEEELEIENDQDIDITSLERDPDKRRPIGSYTLNERDSVRRAYLVHEPCQPLLDNYPSTQCGAQVRRFCHKWFKEWHWLERHNVNTQCFSTQVGKLRNPSKHIENVINKLSSQELAKNRLRLIATIEAVRLLTRQGCSFRGHDEPVDSLNGGNFYAVLGSFKRINDEGNKVVDNAPGNAKYTSPKIQKQIANILGNKVRAMIRSEVGDSKFSILVDEALDVSNKEKIAIILRFVDRGGLIRERFFKVISIGHTCSQTLKDEICKVLAQYNPQVENIRGQGYDGANNMRGQFKGLQALFLKECPYAYYVHCFAHRLQLCLNAAAKGVRDVWQFFSTLTLIVNFVDSSAKRHSMLKIFREGQILDLLAAGTLETDLECEFFVADVDKDPRFTKITSISDLCRQMVDFGKTSFYPMIYRLICLILTLPVSTATTERAFSSMKIIKNKLRNKVNDEFFDDLMVLYIERTYADNIENHDVIAEFELSGPRRVKFG